ncbi:unnamed protein product [Haemonchus placei]|uniref:Uncharacterized protein n=1 Tax=Haemonchus placei TaxID=6290 RepID=A0A0N4X014_HAEPC|nr:unnamed protein product [Haemonchus placei]
MFHRISLFEEILKKLDNRACSCPRLPLTSRESVTAPNQRLS